MNTDLTRGTPWRVLLKYLLPLFGSAVFQQLYTLADTVIAGKFAGQTALTAIGASSAIVSILMAVALGANAGCAVLASRYFGAQEYGKSKSTIITSLLAFGGLSIILLIAGICTSRITLELLKTPAEAMEESVTYLNIYYYGLPFLIIYNLGTGIFSALGDSKTPFIFLVFSSVTNIVLDYVMVKPLGVAGVAWATFITQGIACILTVIFVFFRTKKLTPRENTEKSGFNLRILRSLIWLSIPVILQNSFVSVGNLFIQVRINELALADGIGITSGFTAGFRLLLFCTTCLCVCGNGLTNFVSQNFGATEFVRIKRGYYSAIMISSIIAAVFVIICEALAQPLVQLFMPEGEEDIAVALSSGVQFVRIVAPFYLVVNIKINADAAVRGCNNNIGFTVSTFSDLLLRVALVFILTNFLGFAGVAWAWALGWVLGTVIALTFYYTLPCLKKKNIAKLCADADCNNVESVSSSIAE